MTGAEVNTARRPGSTRESDRRSDLVLAEMVLETAFLANICILAAIAEPHEYPWYQRWYQRWYVLRSRPPLRYMGGRTTPLRPPV